MADKKKGKSGNNFWKDRRKWSGGYNDNEPKSEAKTQLDGSGHGCGQNAGAFDNKWRPFLSINHVTDGIFTTVKLRAATKYLTGRDEIETVDELLTSQRFYLNIKEVISNKELVKLWPTIENDLENHLEMVLGIFGIARTLLAEEESPNFPVIRARLNLLQNESRLVPIKDLRAALIDDVVDVSGTVIRVSTVRPLCTWLTFKCKKCSSLSSVEQSFGVYTEPKKCDVAKCKSPNFVPLRSHSQTLTVDWQTIRIQETTPAEKGRVPRTIDCVLTADLCDVAVPGDVIVVKGRLKTCLGSSGPKVGSGTTIHSFQVHAISVSNQKVLESNKRSPNAGLNFTLLDYSAIQEIHSFKSNLFKLLVASLCPSIYGNELIKGGLLLGLFGGTIKGSQSRDKVPIRGDPHILIVGDPGLGKSQMLSGCASVAPRGVFVTATGATSSGLTVTLSREGNEFSLEGGALVLADQGCCCIDEFDKMTGHQALLEAMEQQSISIAKSGIVCTLPARTAIMAAANPLGGHYNKSKTVAENLKLSPALLSRFDIIFIMIDRPDEEHDFFLSEHIMNRHSKGTSSRTQLQISQDKVNLGQDSSLKSRLRTLPSDQLDLLPHPLMRKYIAYARQYVFPTLTKEAATVIQEFYLDLRRSYQTSDSSPITIRQLESLVRLTEARARLELREECTEQDAKDVIEIVKSTLLDTFSDDLGMLDFSRAINGSGVSSRSKVKVFMSAMHKFAHAQSKNLFDAQELKSLMKAVGVQVSSFYEFMETLSNQGYFIKKGHGNYQLLSADF